MSKAASTKEWVLIQIHTTPNEGTILNFYDQTSSQLNSQFNPNTKPQNPPGFPMKQQAFNPNQSKPNLENLIKQFVNQQITINKQNVEQLKQLASKLEQLATHNRVDTQFRDN